MSTRGAGSSDHVPYKPTEQEVEVAGPFPETCYFPDRWQRVEAPWISLKDGWWHCDACKKFAAQTHQPTKAHEKEVMKWLEKEGWSPMKAEAIWNSVKINPEYLGDPPADGAAAAAAADGDPSAPLEKKAKLKSRAAAREEHSDRSSAGDRWPSWDAVQAQAAAALPGEKFFQYIAETFEAKKMLEKLDGNSAEIGNMAEKVKQLGEKLDEVKEKLQTEADDVSTGMNAVKPLRQQFEELKSEVHKVQENVKAEMADVKGVMRDATAAMKRQTEVWEKLIVQDHMPPAHIVAAGAAAAPAPPGLAAEAPAGAPAAAAASEDAAPK